MLKCRSWVQNKDGSYRALEIPGPESYETWYACWRVYYTCCLMLRWPQGQAVANSLYVVTPAALDYYQERFRQLVSEFPECWFLCCKAEDLCRNEHLQRTKRNMQREANGVEPSWSDVFVRVTEDQTFWSREVRNPAVSFLARGRRGGEPTAAYEEDPTGITAKVLAQTAGQSGRGSASSSAMPPPLAPEGPSRKRARKSRTQRMQGAIQRLTEEAQVQAQAQVQQSRRLDQPSSQEHPKKKFGMYVTTREGKEICFSFAKGSRDSCPEPCQHGRVHVCQHCLGAHSNAQCNRANGGKGGGKGGKQASK